MTPQGFQVQLPGSPRHELQNGGLACLCHTNSNLPYHLNSNVPLQLPSPFPQPTSPSQMSIIIMDYGIGRLRVHEYVIVPTCSSCVGILAQARRDSIRFDPSLFLFWSGVVVWVRVHWMFLDPSSPLELDHYFTDTGRHIRCRERCLSCSHKGIQPPGKYIGLGICDQARDPRNCAKRFACALCLEPNPGKDAELVQKCQRIVNDRIELIAQDRIVRDEEMDELQPQPKKQPKKEPHVRRRNRRRKNQKITRSRKRNLSRSSHRRCRSPSADRRLPHDRQPPWERDRGRNLDRGRDRIWDRSADRRLPHYRQPPWERNRGRNLDSNGLRKTQEIDANRVGQEKLEAVDQARSIGRPYQEPQPRSWQEPQPRLDVAQRRPRRSMPTGLASRSWRRSTRPDQ